jgi:hypothetical protein
MGRDDGWFALETQRHLMGYVKYKNKLFLDKH